MRCGRSTGFVLRVPCCVAAGGRESSTCCQEIWCPSAANRPYMLGDTYDSRPLHPVNHQRQLRMTTATSRLPALCVLVALSTPGLEALAATPPPEVSLPLMKSPPQIDGEITAVEWACATKVLGFVGYRSGKVTPRDGRFWVGCDGKELFIAVQTEMPPDGKLLNRAVPDGDRDIIAAARDDCIELWIDPHKGQTTGDRRYFQIITNPRGTLFDRAYDLSNQANPVDVSWHVKWRYANKVIAGWWHVEIAIPLDAIGATQDLDHPWGMRVVRNWRRPGGQSHWASAHRAFNDVPSMPVVRWDANAPVTQMTSLHHEHQEPRIAVSVHNPGDRPIAAKVFLSNAWSMDPPREQERSLTVGPGQTESVELVGRDLGPEGDHHTIIRVSSPDGKRTFFFRDFRWNLHRPEVVWTIEKEQRQAVDLKFKHYPYHRKVKVTVDLSALAARDRVKSARVVVRRKGETAALADHLLALPKESAEDVFDVPELPDGEYEIAAFLQGGEGIPKEPVVREFERRHFEWEHNTLGLSNAVIPPFTPLKVSGHTLSCVLRDIQVSDIGLWSQVRSDGRDLLAGPMRWEVTAAGKPLNVRSRPLTVETAAVHRVTTTAAWKAGGLAAQVRCEYDYDGMMKATLSLEPGEQAIDRLSLVIPLRNQRVRYMHTCGDGLRHNYAGRMPAGDGIVWDSSKGNKLNIVGTFYPYIYLGGGARGICWFADTDRDWVLDDKSPTVEVARRGEVVELRVHFVTKPVVLERKHDIEFGLQATPVKPMPEHPKNWRKWRCNKKLPDCFAFTTLGSTFYWGGVTHDLYPRDCDLSIYDWIRDAREKGEADKEFVARWMEGYKPEAQPGTRLWKKYRAHIWYTARAAPGYLRSQGCAMIPYTNARGHGFQSKEWPTFQDEWINFAYYHRVRKGGVGYDITPTESFRDCAMHYYKKAMTCFDGVYWDNVYMAANYDTVAGGAWVDERGRIHPSMGLWNMRALIRRTAILYHEHGRRGVFIPHMTNTNIVPTLAFANVNLDWEWQYGECDFQDRFTPDLTVAQTIGRKTGNVPLILSGGLHNRKHPKYPWVMRTRLGVCLVHEIRMWDHGPPETVELLKKLHEFGYGEPDCRVFNYWDDGHPVKVTGIDAKTIAMSRGGKAIVIVTDYGEGGACTVTFNPDALGIAAPAKAVDFETGETVDGDAGRGFSFELKKHGFRALLLR